MFTFCRFNVYRLFVSDSRDSIEGRAPEPHFFPSWGRSSFVSDRVSQPCDCGRCPTGQV